MGGRAIDPSRSLRGASRILRGAMSAVSRRLLRSRSPRVVSPLTSLRDQCAFSLDGSIQLESHPKNSPRPQTSKETAPTVGMSRYTTPRRDSSSSHKSSSSPKSQRPRLLRSSATTPAITASSSEIQASLVSPNSPHTAAEMLNRMNYVPASYYLGQTTQDDQRSEPVTIESRSDSRESYTPNNSMQDGSYFSFPNFEVWDSPEEEKAEPEKEAYS